MPEQGRPSATASMLPPGPGRAHFRTSRSRTPPRPSFPNTGRRTVALLKESPVEASLDLDDIQAGALRERPSPYVGTYLLLRIDDRSHGRELLRRLIPLVEP